MGNHSGSAPMAANNNFSPTRVSKSASYAAKYASGFFGRSERLKVHPNLVIAANIRWIQPYRGSLKRVQRWMWQKANRYAGCDLPAPAP